MGGRPRCSRPLSSRGKAKRTLWRGSVSILRHSGRGRSGTWLAGDRSFGCIRSFRTLCRPKMQWGREPSVFLGVGNCYRNRRSEQTTGIPSEEVTATFIAVESAVCIRLG